MLLTKFTYWFDSIQQRAASNKHRCLIVLSGEYSWSLPLLESIKNSPRSLSKKLNSDGIDQQDSWLIYSDSPKLKANVNKQNYRYKLGSESQVVVFADNEMNIDALAALSGTIKGGGVLFILFPEKLSTIKKNNNSAFLQRFIKIIELSFASYIVEQGEEFICGQDKVIAESPSTKLAISSLISVDVFPFNCVTQEQYQAVQSIIKVATGHRDRPLVLTADRGRGKSCALGIASAQIIASASLPQHIIITAPHFKALDSFFNQLKDSLPNAQHSSCKVVHDNGIIEFIPVDQLLKQQVEATLLLVDEAAGIPVYLLKTMLEQYHRVVFSSTVHGYEGAGRGFTLKFQSILDEHYKTWYKQIISQPIRWQENDPVEQFIFNVCLLNAQLPALTSDVGAKGEKTLDLNFKHLSKETLLADESLLTQVFAVLVTAHYQTKPSDLKLMLDNSQISVVCLFDQGVVISVALLMREGNKNQNEILAVKHSKRRLRDQFLPQSLMAHCGVDTAFDYNYLRVMRIAVHPQCQNKGIGTLFLSKISEYAENLQVDFIGSSFGCNSQLLNFWLRSNYKLARIGFNQDAASGEHSALVLAALSKSAGVLQSTINSDFYQAFPYLLGDEYRQLSDTLVWSIFSHCPKSYLPKLTPSDVNTVKAFANKQRLYSSCAYSLHLWLQHQFSAPFDKQLMPILARLLKRMPITEVCFSYQLNGKKALNQLILDYVNKQI
ncbi:MAG: GNAT family N-acetyltransferase [Colwellia sp.]|nr:GNAT family N-acetyltransferase [Colwellia sp.]